MFLYQVYICSTNNAFSTSQFHGISHCSQWVKSPRNNPAGDPVTLTLNIEFQINKCGTCILKYKTISSVFVTPIGVIRQEITMAIAGSYPINVCFGSKKTILKSKCLLFSFLGMCNDDFQTYNED